MSSYRRAAAALILFIFIASSLASAQIIYGTPPSVSGRLTVQTWKLTAGNGGRDTTLTQVVMPISVFAPLAPHWELHFDGAVSSSKLNNGITSTSVTSAGQSTVRVFRSFSNDRLFAAGGLVLPTGKTGYDTLQVAVAQLVADEYLNLPLKQLGGGPGLILQVGGASQYEWLLFGGSIGYTLTGSYKYLQSGDKYNPGDELAFQGSAIAGSGTSSVDLDILYKYYGADKVGSVQVFKSGGIASAVLTGNYRFSDGSASISIAEILRSKNSLQFGDALRTEDYQSDGNKTIFAGNIGYMFAPQWRFLLLAEYRALSANKYDPSSAKFFGKSDLFSFGGGLGYNDPGNRYAINGRVVYGTGNADKESLLHPSISITGFEFSLGGRITF